MLAYFDCFSGISGDMTLGAFIDLGVPVSWLKEQIEGIPLRGFDVDVSSVSRNGIQAKSVRVVVKDQTTSRSWIEIRELIENSPLPFDVVTKSLQIFECIAVEEAAIHGCAVGEVHFHEIGGIDAIVDIVGTSLCVEYLGIRTVSASAIPLGRGFVQCDHGMLPVPAPATLAILKEVPVYGTEIDAELVTPTGAAIVSTLADSFGFMPKMVVKATGYGAGSRDLPAIPNLLRITIGETAELTGDLENDRILVIETCIDDMNPELFGYLMDRLFEDGALDVVWSPVYMKKNRPGTRVEILCPIGRKESVIRRILTETTSTGVRYYEVNRAKLHRETIMVETPYGSVEVKQIKDPDGRIRLTPEYDVCKKIALENDIPLRVVYETILKAAGVNVKHRMQ